jgi:hypothetical protein
MHEVSEAMRWIDYELEISIDVIFQSASSLSRLLLDCVMSFPVSWSKNKIDPSL